MPEDLLSYGLIPEFIGRLPVVSAVHQLTREDSIVQILLEPKNALVKQYQRFFSYDSVELVFTEDALWQISTSAPCWETGARGLPFDHRAGPARRHVRAPVAQGRLQVRDHEGDDQAAPPDAGHERRRRLALDELEGQQGLAETRLCRRAALLAPRASSSVAPVASGYERSLRACLETTIAPRRRATFRRDLLARLTPRTPSRLRRAS